MSYASGTFGAAGRSNVITMGPAGDTVVANLSGTYAATVVMERSRTNGATWSQVGNPQSVANATVELTHRSSVPGELVRLNCNAYTSGSVVYALGSYDLSTANPRVRTRMAVFGDSITDNAFYNTAAGLANGGQKYLNKGYATWVRFLTNQRVDIPMDADFGIGGTTLTQMAKGDRLTALLQYNPHYVVVQGGTNDVLASNSFDGMKNNMQRIIDTFVQAGITPFVLPILPRQVAAIDAARLQLLVRFNQWLREFASFKGGNSFYFCDPTVSLIDYGNANGDPLTNYTFDGLHPSATGAYWVGKAIADAVNILVPPRNTCLAHVADIYDSVNNPGGNLLYTAATNRGLMAGTGGTNTVTGNFTPSGSVATGWTSTRAAGGTSTSTGVAAKESPRTDGPNSGERQQLTYAVSVAGGADEVMQLTFGNLTIGSGDIKVGDTIVAECSMEMSGLVKCTGVELFCSEFGGAQGQAGTDMARDASSIAMPAGVTLKGVMRTPPIKIQGDSTTLKMVMQTHLDTTSTTAAAVLKIGDWSLRKVLN